MVDNKKIYGIVTTRDIPVELEHIEHLEQVSSSLKISIIRLRIYSFRPMQVKPRVLTNTLFFLVTLNKNTVIFK